MSVSYDAIEPCVYLLNEPSSKFYKIGYTSNIRSRTSAINSGRVTPVIVINVIPMLDIHSAKQLEKDLHFRLSEFHISREWFNLPNLDVWKQHLEDALKINPPTRLPKPIPIKRVPKPKRSGFNKPSVNVPLLAVQAYVSHSIVQVSQPKPLEDYRNGRRNWKLSDLLLFLK